MQNLNTLSDKYGKQIDHWNGFDVSINARLQNGLVLQGGVSSGKQVEDNCEVVAKLPEMLSISAADAARRRTAARRAARRRSGARRSSATANSRCSRELKALAIYIIPKVDVQVSGSFRSTPGTCAAPRIHRDQRLPGGELDARPAASGQRGERRARHRGAERDVSPSAGRSSTCGSARCCVREGRTVVSMDIYNALNSDAMITQNQAYAS